MDTYISIADDITDDTLRQIEAANGDVVVVHAICRTIEGRRKLARMLKRRGCRTDVVHRLGWATASPVIEARSETCSFSPSSQPSSPPKSESVSDPTPEIGAQPPIEPTESEPPSDRDAPTATSNSSRQKRKRITPSDS